MSIEEEGDYLYLYLYLIIKDLRFPWFVRTSRWYVHPPVPVILCTGLAQHRRTHDLIKQML
jgi:hypothetical protein